jgi:hypothetical protein
MIFPRGVDASPRGRCPVAVVSGPSRLDGDTDFGEGDNTGM